MKCEECCEWSVFDILGDILWWYSLVIFSVVTVFSVCYYRRVSVAHVHPAKPTIHKQNNPLSSISLSLVCSVVHCLFVVLWKVRALFFRKISVFSVHSVQPVQHNQCIKKPAYQEKCTGNDFSHHRYLQKFLRVVCWTTPVSLVSQRYRSSLSRARPVAACKSRFSLYAQTTKLQKIEEFDYTATLRQQQ